MAVHKQREEIVAKSAEDDVLILYQNHSINIQPARFHVLFPCITIVFKLKYGISIYIYGYFTTVRGFSGQVRFSTNLNRLAGVLYSTGCQQWNHSNSSAPRQTGDTHYQDMDGRQFVSVVELGLRSAYFCSFSKPTQNLVGSQVGRTS